MRPLARSSRSLRFSLISSLPLWGGLALTGCGPNGQHAVTLMSPVAQPCKPMDASCKPVYATCEDLGVMTLQVEVGVFRKAQSTIECPPGLESGTAPVSVLYDPGQNFYMVDVSYVQYGQTVHVTSGPFMEDEAATPWRVRLR